MSPLYLKWGVVSHDGEILRWVDLHGNTILAGRDQYFNMLDTSHAMEWEILATFGELAERGKRPGWKQIESRLKLWRAVQSGEVENCIALGVSLVVRRRQGSGWRALIARRAPSKLAIRSGKLHVVPAGMAMPGKSIRHTAIQELLEELLGLEEHRRDISRTAEYKRLKSAGADFKITGIVMNPLNDTVDICATLTIEDDSWWAREPEWRLNHEHGGGLVSIDGAPPWWDIIPQGVGALALAGV